MSDRGLDAWAYLAGIGVTIGGGILAAIHWVSGLGASIKEHERKFMDYDQRMNRVEQENRTIRDLIGHTATRDDVAQLRTETTQQHGEVIRTLIQIASHQRAE